MDRDQAYALAAQIESLRAHTRVLQLQVEVLHQMMGENVSSVPFAGCSHPNVEEVGTFGATELRCVDCKQLV